VNECATIKPCQHTCTNTHGSYTCQCKPCYTKLGTKCDLRQCVIGGKRCYRYHTINPVNYCQNCNSANKFGWTNDDRLKCSDSNACTRGDHCVSGRCVGTPFSCLPCEKCQSDTCKVKPGYCVIVVNGKKTCFNNKAIRPGYPCQQCDSNNPYKWTSNNNLQCSDNNVKTKNDRCVSGVCRGTPYSCLPCESHDGSGCPLKSVHCVIQHNGQRTCFANQNLKPGNPCQWCNSAASKSTWSNRNGVSCDDGNKCTRSDTCKNGQCTGTAFSCNSHCQTCNGRDCSQKPGFGFISGKCTCRISGKDYSHQQINPANQCQWCNLNDAASKPSGAWANRPSVPCNDRNACTKKDLCTKGKCVGQSYSCQSSFPSSSCIKTSVCLGDGRCNDIMRPTGTICRSAKDGCDKPEKCDGRLGSCPADVTDVITIKTGSVQFQNPTFTAIASYQHVTSSLYLRIAGFSITCGVMKYKWYLLDGSSACTTTSISRGVLPNTNTKQVISGLNLQDNKNYKIAIQAVDMRGAARPLVCTSSIAVDTSKPQVGWVYDGNTKDIDYQSTKTITANWGGFKTRHGIAKYEWKVLYTAFGSSATSQLLPFTSTGVVPKASKTFNNIVDGSRVKVVVRAFTKAGLYADSTSDGVIVDLSKPKPAKVYDGSQARVDLKYAKWTNTFSSNWDAFTDSHSGISHYEWAVKRQGAGLITAFKSIGLTRSVSASGLNLVSGERYCAVVKGYNKARLHVDATSDCLLIDRDPPRAGTINDGLSKDVQHQSNGNSISANWNGFSDGAKGSGIVGYQYKITNSKNNEVVGWTSVAKKTTITHSGLSLTNGVKYYVTVKAMDAVGLSTEVKTNGVIVDTTRPVFTGKVDVRGINDVHNGKPCVYVTSRTTLAVTWRGFTDGHSGLDRYEWAVIPAAQSIKPSDLKRVSGSSLTTSASFSGLTLTDGQLYRVVIRAYNRAFLYTDASSVVVIPDSTPPQTGSVSDGSDRGVDIAYQTSLSFVKATWTVFKEPDTGIRQYYYAIGSCIKGNYHITSNKFIPVSPSISTSITLQKLTLINGQRYCTKVKAKNMAGLYSKEATSNGFMVDKTPPDIREARVTDGVTKTDIDYQDDATVMSANWEGIRDHESGIKYFEYGVSRKRAGLPDVSPFKNVGLRTSARATGLSLAEDVYYVIVCAVNNAGLRTCLSSDGVLIDKTQPSKGIVNDGVLEPDVRYQSSLTSMAANWEGIWDLESQIERFEWAIKDNTKDANIALPYVDVGLATHVKNEQPLSLTNGKTYQVHLKVFNHAGRFRDMNSDGVTVDSTAPKPSRIFPGIPGNNDWIHHDSDKIFYTSTSLHIFAFWDAFIEPESEVWYYKWAIGTSKCGTQVQPFINIGRLTHANSTTSDLNFNDGTEYYVTVTSQNKANLVSHSCSEAFMMDKTPPSTGSVNIGDADRHQKHIGSDYIHVYWKGFDDRESGIDYCDISITSSSSNVFITKSRDLPSGSVPVRKSMFISGQVYKAVVKCVNKANLTALQTSDPFTVDYTSPIPQGPIVAGVSRDNSMQYQSDTTSVTAAWPPFKDPESPIKEYWMAIGRSHLDDAVVSLSNVGMATQISRSNLKLVDGTTYYLTVYGVNAAGLNSSVQGLPLRIDVTPPVASNGSVMDGVGKDDWEYFNPKDPVAGHWETISDPESGISKSRYCLGSKPYGCQIKGVTDISNQTTFNCKDCKINPGEQVYITVQVSNGAGLSTTMTSNGMLMDASPPMMSNVIDGDDVSGKDVDTALLHWNISVSWQGAEDRQSGIVECKWQIVDDQDKEIFSFDIAGPYKLGSRQLVSANRSYSSVPFNSSRLYYNVIECTNGARIKAKARSDGFRVVSIWPIPGIVRDGLTIGTDLDYLRSTKDVGTNWDAFKADSRDSVNNYAWSVGTKAGHQDVMKFKTAGLTLQDMVTLAPNEPDLNVLVPGNKYYITVKGTSVSGLSSTQSSNGFIVDTTPPIKSHVKVTFVISDYSNRKIDLRIDWSGVSDNESGILDSELCVGTTPGSCMTNKVSAGAASTAVLPSFTPVSLASYFIMVLVTNKAGLTTTMTSDKISIDTSPPSRGQVIDGIGRDVNFMKTTHSMSIQWGGFEDKDTSVKNCTWRLIEQSASSDGSYFGNDTVVFEESVRSKGKATRGGLALKPGSRYINQITCANRDGFAATSSSNGVVIDLTSPISNTVIDGSDFPHDIDFTSETSKFITAWKGFTDSESSIMGYRWALGTSPGKDDVISFRDVGKQKQGKAENLTLSSGGPYYVTVEGTNQAGLSSQGWSDGFIVDVSPPEILKLTRGFRSWLGPRDFISATWQSYDLQSQIKTTEYCIGTSPNGCQTKPMTMLPHNSTNITCTDCTLHHLVKYYVTVRVWNQAGLYTVATTEKVQADFTPPLPGQVVPTDDVISCTSNCSLMSNISGFTDQESGLNICRFAIRNHDKRFITSFVPFNPPTLASARGLTLEHGQRYYTIVSCTNNVVLETKVSSDIGVLVDVTPPT
ncbi:hypothetical protein QZH41_010660, partial [Actinostola sp. cb2023]